MGRVVFVATSEAQAQMVRDLLRARGIDVELSGAWRAALRGVLPIAQTSIAIEALSDDDAERADAALKQIDAREETEGVWSCPGCGEEVPSGFDVCWKCGGAAAGPITGDVPPAARTDALPPRDLDEPPSDRQRAVGDLLWVLCAGSLPAALMMIWLKHHWSDLGWLTASGRVGLANLIVGIGLALCLVGLRRRGLDLGPAWGGAERWAGGFAGGVLLGLCVGVVDSVIHDALWRLGPHPDHRAAASSFGRTAVGLDTALLLLPGVGLAAATGGLLLYGIALQRLRSLLRSSFAAVGLVAALATLTWAPAGGFAAVVGSFASAVLLGSAALTVRRAWPIALASFVAYLVTWLPTILTRG